MKRSNMGLPHAKSGDVINLVSGGPARTTALVKTASFESVRLLVPLGKTIPPHHVAGELTIYCVEGRVVLHLESGDVCLEAGSWMFLAGGTEHAVLGLDDAILLLTIML
jgi:quercetin dioxygenase-like cupin family protein